MTYSHEMQILKLYMALNDLNQRRMAEKLGVSESYVSLLLRGLRWQPSLAVLQRLSALTGASLDLLAQQCGAKKPRIAKVRPLTPLEIEIASK